MQSPFLITPVTEWIAHNELAFAVFDRFPVSPGHALVVTRRLVPTWFDATAQEQAALMGLVNTVRNILDNSLKPVPDGYNVGFNCGSAAGQTVPHVHIHVIPRYSGDLPDPRGGVRNVIPHRGNYLRDDFVPPNAETAVAQSSSSALTLLPHPAEPILATGAPNSSLWTHLEERLPAATSVDVVSSFVQRSGLDVIGPQLLAAATRGAPVRILVSDYLGISDPLRPAAADGMAGPDPRPACCKSAGKDAADRQAAGCHSIVSSQGMADTGTCRGLSCCWFQQFVTTSAADGN